MVHRQIGFRDHRYASVENDSRVGPRRRKDADRTEVWAARGPRRSAWLSRGLESMPLSEFIALRRSDCMGLQGRRLPHLIGISWAIWQDHRNASGVLLERLASGSRAGVCAAPVPAS